jgi:hypothetical protein
MRKRQPLKAVTRMLIFVFCDRVQRKTALEGCHKDALAGCHLFR